jgi:hypothetical protein
MSVDIDDIEDTPQKPDFRRANGAPVVMVDGKNKRLSRPSSWGKILDDENALVNWKIDRAAEGVAKDPALQARYSAVKPDDRATFKELRELAINAGRGDQAADIGTALHAMSERWEDPDDEFEPPEEYARSLRAYSKTLDEFGLVSELIEYQVVSLKWGAAGTADRCYKATKPIMTPDGEVHPPGTLFLGDLKTGKKLDFSLPGYTVQMAIYADGQLYDVANDEFLPTPPINRDWGILVHLPAGEEFCQLIWCDLGVGELGARLVQEVKQWRRSWKNVAPYGAYEAVLLHTAEEIAEGLEATVVADTAELLEFVKLRLTQIKEHEEALKRLMLKWPEGVPTPKNGLSEPDHIEQVLTLFDQVEAEYGLSFLPGDPRGSKPGERRGHYHKPQEAMQ